MIKELIAVIITAGLLIVSGCIGPSSTGVFYGKYHLESDPGSFIDLRENGNYLVIQKEVDPFGGHYIKENDKVYLLLAFGSFELSVDGNTLIDDEGDRWTK